MAHGDNLPPESVAITPPVRRDRVPIDVEAFEDLGDGTYRLQFLTVADDGMPTRFNEEVTPVGDPEVWLVEFLNEHQTERARLNREAAAKAALLPSTPEQRSGTEDPTLRTRVDSMFPTQRKG